ncbi:glycosyltransferase family 2 protein [Frigidibacter oleivorans]|uniref:glycosyltransferase family 2 protein n=1 Tax=Frigidibacter oleivorans TaxID=2487129 RepID=UPI000F8DC96E|nr:glycosyltransferase family 2 protein [Frigidibacter oleivorans]
MPDPEPADAGSGPAHPEAPPPEAAIIIPHYNDVDRLLRCLAALVPQLRPAVELVIVDNGSTDSLAPLAAAHPGLRVVTEPEKGAAAARNRGVRDTTAPWLFFLDADCVPAADWLDRALGHARVGEAAAQADLIAGRVDVFDESPGPRSGAEAFETVFAFRCRDYVEKEGFSVTANLLTRRAVFLATGDFVNGLPEDKEWCLRARARGFAIAYDDALAVAHPTRRDWPALRRKWRRLSQEAHALHRLQGGGAGAWALRAGAVLASGFAHLPQMLRAPLAPGERRRGAATLLRLRAVRAGWMARQALGLPI